MPPAFSLLAIKPAPAKHPAHDVDGRMKPPATHLGLADKSVCKEIYEIAPDKNILQCADAHKDYEVQMQLPRQQHGRTRIQAPVLLTHTKPKPLEALALPPDEEPPALGSIGK
jgi:hypothetical protein